MNQLELTWPPPPVDLSKPLGQRRSRKGTTYRKKPKECDCGRPAVTKFCNDDVCQKCYDIDTNQPFRHLECKGELSGNRRELSRMGVGMGMVYTPVFNKGMDRWNPDDIALE
jgi:hypothetical protein